MSILSILDRTRTEYREFIPPRRPEEFVGIAGPHNGLALPHDVLAAIAKAKVEKRGHPYMIRGEWVRSDGVRYLDLAVTPEWIEHNTLYRRDERGQLRWTCPECGKRGGGHTKACQFE